jgi:hypothetical protein
MGKNQRFPIKEEHMNSIADGSVIVQTSADSLPCPPPWWGELVLLSQHLRKQGILTRLTEGIRFERRRFGHYELIDFLVVLFGYARPVPSAPWSASTRQYGPGPIPSWPSLGGIGCPPAQPFRVRWRP